MKVLVKKRNIQTGNVTATVKEFKSMTEAFNWMDKKNENWSPTKKYYIASIALASDLQFQ